MYLDEDFGLADDDDASGDDDDDGAGCESCSVAGRGLPTPSGWLLMAGLLGFAGVRRRS